MINIEISENERQVILEAINIYYRKMDEKRNRDFSKAKNIEELKKVTDKYRDKENAIYQLRPKLHVSELMEAMRRVTFEMVKDIGREGGEAVQLTNGYELYSYYNEESVVVRDNISGQEVYEVQIDFDTKRVEFYEL